MSRNEAQTRVELIDPALFARGWVHADIRLEETAAAIDMVYGKLKSLNRLPAAFLAEAFQGGS